MKYLLTLFLCILFLAVGTESVYADNHDPNQANFIPGIISHPPLFSRITHWEGGEIVQIGANGSPYHVRPSGLYRFRFTTS